MSDLADLVGKVALVGIRVFGADEELHDQFQVHGTIIRADGAGVVVERPDGRPFGLPPGRELFEDAGPGEYHLRSTGETVVDPDLLVTLAIHDVDEESVEELRDHGYLPPED